jgi:hypothetical protein
MARASSSGGMEWHPLAMDVAEHMPAGARQPHLRHLRILTDALQGRTDLRRFQPRSERPEGLILRDWGVGHEGRLGGGLRHGWGVLAVGGRESGE